MIGQTVSHYRILEPLGEGGMGSVYLAEDTHLGRRVAIKFPSLSSNEYDYRMRFLREARAVSELNHPNIATLFDYGESDDGQPFLVMELARGRTLSEIMRNGELTLPKAISIVAEVATALTESHARGVVHRDIKPSNIMVDDNGQVKVLDFGLAKQLNAERLVESTPEAQTVYSTQTRSGIVLGTPAYLSPEQARGEPVDGRSDLFALGIVLYEALTGRIPFSGRSFIEIAASVLHVNPDPPSKINSRVKPELDQILLKMLAKKPDDRYQTAQELVERLRAVQDSLSDDTSQTMIMRTSPTTPAAPTGALSQISQVLRRPRVPISYILIGVVATAMLTWGAWRVVRPSPHQPSAEAQRWYEVGTAALRDGAFYQASKALERAIAADDAYMLAHARLAEALVELDYVDRAKDELLRVTATDRSTLLKNDALYLDAIAATARHDFSKSIELYRQIVQQAPEAEKPFVFVDLGRAYEKNDDVKQAVESYKEATNRSPQYATAFLRLGVLYGRQQELTGALAAFDKAEEIYQALGNVEGRAEVAFQRGALFNKLNKLSDAKAQLEQALNLARTAANKSQEIKTLLQLSSASMDAGEPARATDYAHQAVDLAQKNGMENLGARGLVDLGNAFLIRGDLNEAEKYFQQALETAGRNKARNLESRARISMASLRLQQGNPDEVVRLVEPALSFYEQGGYRTETSLAYGLLARANKQKGDYDAALKVDAQILQLAEQWKDQSQIAFAHSEMGQVLVLQEKFQEALDHFDRAYTINKAQGVQRAIGYNLLYRGNIFWQIGRYDEARTVLGEAALIADKSDGGYQALSLELKLVDSEIALSQGRFAEARTKSENLIATIGTQFPSTAMNAKRVLGLALANSGGKAAGIQACADAVEMSKKVNDPWRLSRMQLALAEAMLLGGNLQNALNLALELRESFARSGQQGSEWRAWIIAGVASRIANDTSKAREYGLKSAEILSKLEQRWGSANYNSYINRQDIQRFRKQLGEVTVSN